ncbi:hypothetical protein B1812_06300 [Methylocystis bryophila]|uniref:Cytochrome c domain-containing protein n=1 Tax=Methylocystis bryophila TaxID=655015 RepID=A0A1W6MT25_9HYPH|nr:hypothetical protein B1812_06300 [Methylocystis bryophila]
MAALKDYVGGNARKLFLNYASWDAAAAHWYTEPWLGSRRESIHGTYSAGNFDDQSFPNTGLKVTFDTHVLTYYDERAAYSLHKVWKADAMNPEIKTENFQFDEGSVIVKAAIFVSDDPKKQSDWWPGVTQGAAQWPLYIAIPEGQQGAARTVVNGYVMQFDIIVKDSVAAPKTGWVFATLVYDADAPGKDAWDKMVPLGAQWGNDPDVNSALNPPPPLKENWINPVAPFYATQTLGWGGRLSGPNDGARNNIQVGDNVMLNAPDSSCMSCHSPAQWQPVQHKMLSFLLPSYPNPKAGPPFRPCPDGKPDDPYICSPAPGSKDWFRWFQDRLGTEPFDPDTGSIATDFDMVFAFKSLPMWWKAIGPADQPALFAIRPSGAAKRYNEYSGAPLAR